MASFSSCSSTVMTVVGAELTGDVFDQLAFEGLVDGDKDALHQEGGDQVFAADVELFGEILDADAFGDCDGLGDW